MTVAVGTELPPWRLDEVPATHMRLYAAIARDPNPIHFDRDEAAKRGLGERCVTQGPINLAYVMNMLNAWAGPESLREIAVRFTANVFEGDAVVAGGVVTAVREDGGERLADCEVWLEKADGTRTVQGTATVALA
jgi:acyl dehydratase